VEALLWWFSSDRSAAEFKKGNYGMTWAAFCEDCRKIRNVIRRRMKARGLLGR
jgi:hypothetical protein